MEDKKLSVIKEIASWNCHDESTKIYFIKCYLLGYTSEEQIHAITKKDS